jgi:catechol 2,3-dioxygenase-like lactoylglutathione lyase family enzyme
MHRLLIVALCTAPLVAQLSAPNDAGVSIGHIHLMVSDPEPHRKLWVDLLGAEVVHAGSLELYKLPGVYIIVGKARTAPTDGSEGSTVNHFGFLVPSYQEIRAKLSAAGITFATDNPNTKQVIARFPDKINVEFTETPDLKMPAVFHHIHISTPDQEKGRAWYAKTFGARAGMRGTFPAAFIPGAEVDFRKAQQAEAPTKGRSLDHIGFEVKNLEAFCKKLEADGVKLEIPYREMPQLGGLKLAFLVDPEGTRIELTEGLGAAK